MLILLNISFSILILFVILILVAHAISLAYVLIDISKSEFKNPRDKIFWTTIVVMAPLIGITLYLNMGKSQKIKKMQ
ncbi:PLDc N-terminal domain-containing protein [Daejeonella sp.]|uniref:PLDc N-terminal domain-containing protein n=1 Tax=Daejeonella sp. TaxID=2805397 RepID=UPI003435B528